MDKRLIDLGRHVAAGVIAGAMVCAWAPTASALGKPAAKAATSKSGSQGAGAKPDLAAAKKHYAEGDKKFKAGDFSGALADFEIANDIKATPQAERYLGMCEDALGHFTKAVEWYDKFLAHVPAKLKEQGDEIQKREGEIKALPGKVHLDSTPSGASVSVDDKPQASPTPLDIELSAGTHKITFSATGRLPTSKAVDVAYASAQTVSVALDPAPEAPPPPPPPPAPVAAAPAAAAPPPPPPPEPRSKVPAYITGGLAIVAAGVGTAFGVMALGDKSDFDKNPTTSTADNGDTHALIADMSFGVAITFGVTSAVLFLTNDEPAPAASRADEHTETADAAPVKKASFKVTPEPIVGPHTGGAGVLVQF